MLDTQEIGIRDIVKLAGSDEEWRVYWIYRNGQVELSDKYGRSFNDRIITLNDLTLLRKGE